MVPQVITTQKFSEQIHVYTWSTFKCRSFWLKNLLKMLDLEQEQEHFNVYIRTTSLDPLANPSFKRINWSRIHSIYSMRLRITRASIFHKGLNSARINIGRYYKSVNIHPYLSRKRLLDNPMKMKALQEHIETLQQKKNEFCNIDVSDPNPIFSRWLDPDPHYLILWPIITNQASFLSYETCSARRPSFYSRMEKICFLRTKVCRKLVHPPSRILVKHHVTGCPSYVINFVLYNTGCPLYCVKFLHPERLRA